MKLPNIKVPAEIKQAVKKDLNNLIKNKVRTNQFDYQEEVKEFTGLMFHCPNCDEAFHLHIAQVRLEK